MLDVTPSKTGRQGEWAAGWLISPGAQPRYYLAPDPANPTGDTLVGVSSAGTTVSVYLPDCTLERATGSPAAGNLAVGSIAAEPAFPAVDQPITSFEVTLDGDTSFGNPQF